MERPVGKKAPSTEQAEGPMEGPVRKETLIPSPTPGWVKSTMRSKTGMMRKGKRTGWGRGRYCLVMLKGGCLVIANHFTFMFVLQSKLVPEINRNTLYHSSFRNVKIE